MSFQPSPTGVPSGNLQTAPAGTSLPVPLTVEVVAYGGYTSFPAQGIAVTFEVAGGGGTLSVTTTSTDAKGLASTTLTLGAQPGTNTVTATIFPGSRGMKVATFTETGN